MENRSNNATAFIAVAHYRDHPATEGDVGNMRLETVAIKPETTAKEIFDHFFPSGELATHLYRPPFQIEILPDHATVPEAEKLPF